MPKSARNDPTLQERDRKIDEELEIMKDVNAIELSQITADNTIAVRNAEFAAEVPEKVQHLLKLMKPIDIALPKAPGELWEYATRALGEAATNTARAGFAFLMLKETTPQGKFLGELQAREISPRTAQDAMAVAKLLLKLPESNTRTLAHLAGSKLIELARIPEETLEDIMKTEQIDGKPLDELDRMSVRELKATVRKLKERHAKELELKAKDLERKDREIVKLSGTIDEINAAALPPDEAEEAALAKLAKIQFNFDALIGSIIMARFDQASPKVVLRAFHLCEYMEYSARFEATNIRHKNPQVYEDMWANENEVVQAQAEMDEKAEKLPSFGGKDSLK